MNYATEVTEYSVKSSKLKSTVKYNEITEIIKSMKIHDIYSRCIYKITILGYHTTDVTQTIHDSGKIEFNAQNRGLARMIWPMNNYYSTTYNFQDFSLKEWSKNIKQGSYKNKIDCTLKTVIRFPLITGSFSSRHCCLTVSLAYFVLGIVDFRFVCIFDWLQSKFR